MNSFKIIFNIFLFFKNIERVVVLPVNGRLRARKRKTLDERKGREMELVYS